MYYTYFILKKLNCRYASNLYNNFESVSIEDLGGYFTDDTNTKTRTREWLTEYKIFRNAEFQTGFSYFIFEEVAQWLDDFFEIYVIRQSSDIMVRFDNGGFSADTALYNVRVDGSLYKEVYGTDFLCLFFEDTDKFFTDNFTFFSGSSTPFNLA